MSGPGVERSPKGFVQEPAEGSPGNHAMLYIEDNENNIALVEAVLRRRPHIELHVAINVLSSDSSEIIDELLADGAAESVGKPFDIRQFLAIIDRYLPDEPERQ